MLLLQELDNLGCFRLGLSHLHGLITSVIVAASLLFCRRVGVFCCEFAAAAHVDVTSRSALEWRVIRLLIRHYLVF